MLFKLYNSALKCCVIGFLIISLDCVCVHYRDQCVSPVWAVQLIPGCGSMNSELIEKPIALDTDAANAFVWTRLFLRCRTTNGRPEGFWVTLAAINIRIQKLLLHPQAYFSAPFIIAKSFSFKATLSNVFTFHMWFFWSPLLCKNISTHLYFWKRV